MKTRPAFLTALLAGIVWLPLGGSAQTLSRQPVGEAFSGAVSFTEGEGSPSATSAPDSSLYADGERAINEGRWSDAEAIFAKVASQHGVHADGALYWKAYAQNKQGQVKPALDTCAELGRDFATSSWNHECGALEIEIHARNGKPVEPKTGDDDDLKLLALNSLMKKDEPRALAQIQEILNGDSSEKLKKEALFILGHHYSDATYAEIVRISYVEGDVRISRGTQNEKDGGATWEKAVADLPLEVGFSLVTGAGRAEIELEDASTLYLGENSVLTFNDLHTTGGVPYTELALLTGTVTLHVRPYVAGEMVVLKTPKDQLSVRYPGKSDLRVTSYADATAIASQGANVLRLPGIKEEALTNGQTEFYDEGHRIASPFSIDPDTFAAWDKWVANRVAQRSAAISDVMKASGLTSPIPGMADMNGRGTFFECAPYGTCWEPTATNKKLQPDNKLPQTRPSSMEYVRRPAHLVRTGFVETPRSSSLQAMQEASPTLAEIEEREVFDFPCFPSALRYRVERDTTTGKERVIAQAIFPLPYAWAVCHAGSWIHRQHHYVWVVGHKRHHMEPVRWVKSGHRVAFVPIHPYDVKGKPPINGKEEVFAVRNKNGLSVELVKLEAGRPIEFLKSPPREYRNAYLPPLARAEEPRMEAHQLREAMGSKGTVARAGIPLSFDHKSGNFMIAQHVMQGNRSVTVMEPMSNHSGNLQARGGSFSGGAGFRGGSGGSSGGGSRGGGGGSSSSGGGSRGGGGGRSSSGGRSRGGGGGGGSSVSSSGSSAGSSSAGSVSAGSSGAGVVSAGSSHR